MIMVTGAKNHISNKKQLPFSVPANGWCRLGVFVEALLFSRPNDQHVVPADDSSEHSSEDHCSDAQPPEADGAVEARTDCAQTSE